FRCGSHEPPSQPTEMWADGCEIDFVVNLKRFVRPIVGRAGFQTDPAIPRAIDMSFDFHVEVVIGPGESDYAATADYAPTAATPNRAVRVRRVTVAPNSPFPRWPPAASSAAKSAHLGRTGHGPLPRAC